MAKSKVYIKVRLILYNKGNILLLRQKKSYGGNFTLVGGTVENMEYARKALIREAKEEAGLIIKKEHLQLVHVLHKKTGKGQRLTLYFKAKKWSGTLKTGEPDKFLGVAWASLHSLPANLTETVRHVLQKYREGKMYSEFE